MITDGRFSGGSHGFVIGHVTPEAQEGGPIGLVKVSMQAAVSQSGVGVRTARREAVGVAQRCWTKGLCAYWWWLGVLVKQRLWQAAVGCREFGAIRVTN